MLSHSALSNLSIHVYGLGAVAFGLVGLVCGDFANRLVAGLGFAVRPPHREALAYIVAVCLLVGGAVIQWRRTAQIVVLAIPYLKKPLLNSKSEDKVGCSGLPGPLQTTKFLR